MICFSKNGTLELPKQLLKELGWRNNERLNASLLNDNLILQRVPHTVRNRLLIRCFGNFSIEWNGTEINLKNKKLKELIALLAIENGVFLSKSYISGTLWPDSPSEKARDCLYKVIRNLRNYMDMSPFLPIEIQRGQMRICLQDHELDILIFEKLAMQHNKSKEQFRMMFSLYRGNVLEKECYEWSTLIQTKFEILTEIFFEIHSKNSD